MKDIVCILCIKEYRMGLLEFIWHELYLKRIICIMGMNCITIVSIGFSVTSEYFYLLWFGYYADLYLSVSLWSLSIVKTSIMIVMMFSVNRYYWYLIIGNSWRKFSVWDILIMLWVLMDSACRYENKWGPGALGLKIPKPPEGKQCVGCLEPAVWSPESR